MRSRISPPPPHSLIRRGGGRIFQKEDSVAGKTALQLLWIDIESTSLPKEGDGIIDFRDVHVLEFAMILTDTALNIDEGVGGYHEVIKMTRPAADALKANPEVREMHATNGLIQESIAATMTLADVDAEVDKILRTETTFDKREFAIAGSGVAAFDHPLIKAKMPLLASWLAYYPYDIGIERRVSTAFAGRQLVNYAPKSYGEEKMHRAMADVEAHLREAQDYRAFYRSLPKPSRLEATND